jgi:hypothetical protein
VPFTFSLLLLRNHLNLHTKDVQERMGFLYLAYQLDVWWFEVFDMVHFRDRIWKKHRQRSTNAEKREKRAIARDR